MRGDFLWVWVKQIFLKFKEVGDFVGIPVAEGEGEGGLVVDVAVLGVFDHAVVPD